MTSAPGTKKKTAARTHKLIDEVPLCPAAAIQRGPSTVAMLNSSTSQKPIVLRNCALGSSALGVEMVIGSPGPGEGPLTALGNHWNHNGPSAGGSRISCATQALRASGAGFPEYRANRIPGDGS